MPEEGTVIGIVPVPKTNCHCVIFGALPFHSNLISVIGKKKVTRKSC